MEVLSFGLSTRCGPFQVGKLWALWSVLWIMLYLLIHLATLAPDKLMIMSFLFHKLQGKSSLQHTPLSQKFIGCLNRARADVQPCSHGRDVWLLDNMLSAERLVACFLLLPAMQTLGERHSESIMHRDFDSSRKANCLFVNLDWQPSNIR